MATKAKANRRTATGALHKERFPGEVRNYRAARIGTRNSRMEHRRENVENQRRKSKGLNSAISPRLPIITPYVNIGG